MHPLLRMLKDVSHSVAGIRNGCILLTVLGLLMAVGANFSVYRPNAPESMEALFQLYLQLEQEPDETPVPFDPESMNLFETESLTRQWTDLLESGESVWPGEIPDEPGIRFGIGLYHLRQNNRSKALQWFHRENQAFPDPFVRRTLLVTALRTGNPDIQDHWFQHPDYIEDTRGSLRFTLGIRRKDWGLMLGNFWIMELERLRPDALMLTLLAGLLWSAMLAGLYSGPKGMSRLIWIPLAVGLGWISTWPTIFSGIWLDGRFGLSEGDNFMVGLAYFLVSVGLREELCKLLLFSPFLLITVQKNRDAEALILGALVGLGFAIEENMGYFNPMSSGVMVSRFISANILHFTLTGVTSLALTRAVRDPQRWLGDSVQIIGCAIGLHAIYNSLLTHPVPGLGDMSYFHGTALVGCCYLFFREAATLCPPRPAVLSLSAIFCWGFCLLFALEATHAAASFPLPIALALSGGAAVTSVLSGYVFLHVMNEPLNS